MQTHECTHTHTCTHTQHNLFDLHELNAANPTRNNPLEPVILAERLARAQKDAESQREERGAAEKRCEQLQQQNELLRADLALAVGEGIKYREALREWAEIEEQRLAQGTPAPAPGDDVGVLKREVEMLREARQKEMAAAKEKFERELRRSEADVLVLKVKVCFVMCVRAQLGQEAAHAPRELLRAAPSCSELTRTHTIHSLCAPSKEGLGNIFSPSHPHPATAAGAPPTLSRRPSTPPLSHTHTWRTFLSSARPRAADHPGRPRRNPRRHAVTALPAWALIHKYKRARAHTHTKHTHTHTHKYTNEGGVSEASQDQE